MCIRDRAKTEVKFSQEKPVFEAVYVACKNAIMANDNMPRIEHKDKPAPAARPQESAPVYEQQRFAVAKPAMPPAAPAPEKTGQDVPDLEDFLVAVPPRAQKPRSFGMYAAAPRILPVSYTHLKTSLPISTRSHRSSATSACAPIPILSAASRTRRIPNASAACCTKWVMK